MASWRFKNIALGMRREKRQEHSSRNADPVVRRARKAADHAENVTAGLPKEQ
jgi:hypothetical protein